MLEHQTAHATVRTSDPITRIITEMVVSREPVTQAQFDGVLAMVSSQIRKRFELSQLGAEQAVRPILRRLLPITIPAWVNGSVRR